MINPKFLVIDLFCGAGGTSTGFDNEFCKVIACVNHDANAIKSHAANHPETVHFTEDITDRTVVVKLLEVLKQYQAAFPNALLILWASLECTNFSKAKGGQPRDPDSRSLADSMEMYIEFLKPDYFMVENVVEFMAWGPLDKNGKPISRKNGCDFLRWQNEINRHGYCSDWKELNAADFGAYTSRNRLFGVITQNSRVS